MIADAALQDAVAALANVVGCIGACVLDRQGNVLAHRLPPPYEAVLLSGAMGQLGIAIEMYTSIEAQPAPRVFVGRFEDVGGLSLGGGRDVTAFSVRLAGVGPDEADLAAVLGHEIGHITAEHLKKQNRKGMISGLASAATAIFTGMPALADAVAANADMTLLILDNETVGMTGAQDTVLPQSRLADVIRGLGVPEERCVVVDAHPRKVHDNAEVLRQAIARKGLSVVIARRECKVAAKRRQRAAAIAGQEVAS